MSLTEELRKVIQASGDRNAAKAHHVDLTALATKVFERELGESRPAEWQVASFHQRWLQGTALSDLSQSLSRTIRSHWPSLSDSTHRSYVELAAEMILIRFVRGAWQRPGLLAPHELPLPRFELLRRFAESATARSNASLNPTRYATELGFVTSGATTAAGRAFLEMRGRDAVRWVIANEIARATGPSDPWRCPRDVADRVLAWVGVRAHTTDVAESHLVRFEELDLITGLQDDASGWSYEVTTFGAEIGRELAREHLPPLYGVALSLAGDDGASALQSAGLLPRNIATNFAQEAVIHQTRSFVHELRNKLHPLQTATRVLIAEVEPSSQRSKATELASAALSDLFSYLESVVQLATILHASHDPFLLGPAIRDGIAQGRNGDRVATIVHSASFERYELRGPRAEFVHAVANLVRNAIQSRVAPATIKITLEKNETTFDLLFDDDGPGVRPDLRERIFDAGYSTRPGGSGTGLAMVRELVQSIEGVVACLDSPMNGARFRIRLPQDRLISTAEAVQGDPS